MVFERFTLPARHVIARSQEVAREGRCRRIDTHHLLVALAAELSTDSSRALEYLGISEAELRAQAGRYGKKHWRASPAHIPLAERVKDAVGAALREADRRGDPEVRSGDLLAGLAGNEHCAAGRILADLGVDRRAARAAVERASSPPPVIPAAELADPRRSGVWHDDAGAREVPNAAHRAAGTGRDVPVRVECSESIRVPAPERAWPMLSSPAAWSLPDNSCFMFDVPGAERLRFLLNVGAEGIGYTVFEVRDEVPGRKITLQGRSAGRPSFTLSVMPGRRGQVQARIAVSMTVQRARKAAVEKRLRHESRRWLRALREVIEGRAAAPGDRIPARVHAACMAARRLEQHHRLSAAVLIDAEPDTVWKSVRSLDTGRLIGPRPASYSGYLPGTPTGQIGEMHYFIGRGSDGLLQGSVNIVIEYAEKRNTATRRAGPPYDEISYLLTGLAGQTRLEVQYRRPVLTRDEETEKREMADYAQSIAHGYKAIVEGPAQGKTSRHSP